MSSLTHAVTSAAAASPLGGDDFPASVASFKRRSTSVIVSPPSPDRNTTSSEHRVQAHYLRSGTPTRTNGDRHVSPGARHQASRVAVLSKYVDELERERFLLIEEIARLRRERDEAVAAEQSANNARIRSDERCVHLEHEVSRLLQAVHAANNVTSNMFSNSFGGNQSALGRERSATPLPPPSTPPRTPPLSFQRREPILSPAPPPPSSVAAAIVALTEDIRLVKNRLDVTEAIQSSLAPVTGSPDISIASAVLNRNSALQSPPSKRSDTLLLQSSLAQLLQHQASPETVVGSPSPSPPPPSVSPPTAHYDRRHGGTSQENVSTISSASDDERMLLDVDRLRGPVGRQWTRNDVVEHASPQRPSQRSLLAGTVAFVDSSQEEENGHDDQWRAERAMSPQSLIPFSFVLPTSGAPAASQRFGIAFPSPRR